MQRNWVSVTISSITRFRKKFNPANYDFDVELITKGNCYKDSIPLILKCYSLNDELVIHCPWPIFN